MEEQKFISEKTLRQANDEARELKRKFKYWLSTEEGLAVAKNLFEVFATLPAGPITKLDYVRHCGRQEVINYILKHGGVLDGDKQ